VSVAQASNWCLVHYRVFDPRLVLGIFWCGSMLLVDGKLSVDQASNWRLVHYRVFNPCLILGICFWCCSILLAGGKCLLAAFAFVRANRSDIRRRCLGLCSLRRTSKTTGPLPRVGCSATVWRDLIAGDRLVKHVQRAGIDMITSSAMTGSNSTMPLGKGQCYGVPKSC
jgi:hypothetical protein